MVTLIFLGLVGGLITGISPCILPVLPVIFLSGGAQSVRASDGSVAPRTSARPFLVVLGLAISFSVFTLLGTLVLSALPVPEDIIRWIGLVLLVLLGIGMIVPRFQHLLEKPFSRIPQRQVGTDRGGFALGLILGTVYVPCAGPVLAAITVAGATGKIGASTIVLTIAFAIGTAAPLLFFALAGRGVAERVRAFRTRQQAIRVGAGVVVLGLAVALAFNATDAIQRAIPDYTASLNHALENAGSDAALGSAAGGGSSASQSLASCEQEASFTVVKTLRSCGKAPALAGIQQWFNTSDDKPVTLASLKGKVVLVDFWAYSCINCQRAIAHVEQWYKTYSPDGLVVVGVHTPEYAFEHVPADVKAGAARLGVTYPVALDNDYKTWNAYGNTSWPADYLIDAKGDIRNVSIGEGDYSGLEGMIRSLITAASPSVSLPATTKVTDTTPTDENQTPETYLGVKRATADRSTPALVSGTRTYAPQSSVAPNSFSLGGTWKGSAEAISSVAGSSPSTLSLAYTASKVYLDVAGTGTITAKVGGTTTTLKVSGAPNIYTVASSSGVRTGTVTVTLSPGLSAYSFTFG
ncbi:thiol:disulfide interchange protein [Frondihabitans sp. PAMC 28766]|uniref:cytochrome c biogenesis protein DipZ n=1 Tax=Frondihabitans sp. PAMC 28766 TaxID=1795630 RepID=UPI00078EE11E|nr:cytochrome c biogenesis protein DipZ [Frondihabitans sp. PAMC 28766]AMM20685.1 thiol:disulfide interchange protein [Frondihabitans sp. PAMC 28766]